MGLLAGNAAAPSSRADRQVPPAQWTQPGDRGSRIRQGLGRRRRSDDVICRIAGFRQCEGDASSQLGRRTTEGQPYLSALPYLRRTRFTGHSQPHETRAQIKRPQKSYSVFDKQSHIVLSISQGDAKLDAKPRVFWSMSGHDIHQDRLTCRSSGLRKGWPKRHSCSRSRTADEY